MSQQVPSVGRIVHYHERAEADSVHTTEPRAAIITKVHSPVEVSMTVFTPDGSRQEVAPYSDEPEAGFWSWPPRV